MRWRSSVAHLRVSKRMRFMSPFALRGTLSGPSAWQNSGRVLRLFKSEARRSINQAQLSCPVNMSVLDT
jgi:hypothetical protein